MSVRETAEIMKRAKKAKADVTRDMLRARPGIRTRIHGWLRSLFGWVERSARRNIHDEMNR